MKNKCVKLLFAAFLILCSSVSAGAYDFEAGGIYYDITSAEEKTVWVTSSGNQDLVYSGNVVIPSTVDYDGSTYAVIGISDTAFRRCPELISVEIPGSVMRIGGGLFAESPALERVTVAADNAVYDSRDNCNAIIETNTGTLIAGCKNSFIPANVTDIGSYAFYRCSGLASIEIPGSVKEIHYWAFFECTELTSIVIPEGVTVIGNEVFCGCTSLENVEISNTVAIIMAGVFQGCKSLSSISIPGSVTSLGARAFYACSALESVSIGNGIKSINNLVFDSCESLETIEIPDNVTSIGENAFCCCSALKSVTIGSGVTSIGKEAFYDCKSLETIEIPDNVTSIGESAFLGSPIKKLMLGNGVNFIGEYAFNSAWVEVHIKDLSAWCSMEVVGGRDTLPVETIYLNGELLTDVVIPDGVTKIRHYAFECQDGITSVTIPNSVKTIEMAAFYGCNNLADVTIGSGVTNIGDEAFMCKNLINVTSLAATAPVLGSDVFGEVARLYHPENSDYSTWSTYFESTGFAYDNTIEVVDTDARTGRQSKLSVEMKNVDEITAFQFDIYLPDGITIPNDEDGYPLIELGSRATTRHLVESAVQADGALRVLCYSSRNTLFSGNEGEVLSITIDVASDLAAGDYTIELKNIELTEVDETAHNVPLTTAEISVFSYITGDVNGDEKISVTDVAGVVNLVLASAEFTDNRAADVNEDGKISVTDVTGVVNLVLNPSTNSVARSRVNTVRTEESAIMIAPFAITAGEQKDIQVLMNNSGDSFTAFQFDLELPEGIEVVTDEDGYYLAEPGARATSRHLAECAEQQDGSLRVLCYSSRNTVFSGESGEVLVLTIKASDDFAAGIYDMEMKNVELSRPDETYAAPSDYVASIIAGGGATDTPCLKGYFTSDAMNEISNVFAAACNITSIDLTGAVYIDATGTLTTGNGNTLIVLPVGADIANECNVIVDGVCDNLSLSDSEAFNAPVDFEANTMSYNREFSNATIATFILPVEVPLSMINGDVYKFGGNEGSTLRFARVEEETLEANKPYVVKIDEAGMLLNDTFRDVEIVATPEDLSFTIGGIAHVGSYMSREVVSGKDTYFGYSGGEFVKANSGTLAPFRTMVVSYGATSSTNSFRIDFDEATGVVELPVAEHVDSECYDFSGRRVLAPGKGVYIIGGKKVLIK